MAIINEAHAALSNIDTKTAYDNKIRASHEELPPTKVEVRLVCCFYTHLYIFLSISQIFY